MDFMGFKGSWRSSRCDGDQNFINIKEAEGEMGLCIT
jgi:hypothetical protein